MPSQKRIFVSVNTSWNVFNFRMNLLKALQDQGHKITVCTPYDNYSSKIEEAGFEYIPLKMENKGNNPIKDLSVCFQYFKALRKSKADLSLFFTIKPNLYGTIASYLQGVKVINNVTGLGTAFIRENWINKLVKALYKFAFAKSSVVFFQNEDDLALFTKNNLVSPGICDILPGSGIDLTKFSPTPLNPKLTVYFISRLLIDKGTYEFLEATEKIKQEYGDQITFKVIGKEETEAKLGVSLEEIKSYEKRGILKYLGTTDNIKNIIADSTVVILPSYREGTPRTLLEAAAMGRPLITTDVPGCKGLINNNGWLCEVKSSESIITALRELIESSPEDLDQFGINSRKLVELKYDEQIVINKYIKKINSLL